jgi:hypothetical protein
MAVHSRRKKKSREPDYIRPQDWCLHHRGADEDVIREIIDVLKTKEQHIEVPTENGAALSHDDFRNAIRASVARGHVRFLMLLTHNFSGPACRQTLWPLVQEFGATVSFVLVRVERCDIGKQDWVSCDLAGLDDPEDRREQILRLAPDNPEYARSCGRTFAPEP